MLSGMDAWSVLRSFLKTMLPSCSTPEMTRSKPWATKAGQQQTRAGGSPCHAGSHSPEILSTSQAGTPCAQESQAGLMAAGGPAALEGSHLPASMASVPKAPRRPQLG